MSGYGMLASDFLIGLVVMDKGEGPVNETCVQ